MTLVKTLIWDYWNKKHITKHNVSQKEVEEICHGQYQAVKSYRKRIQLIGKTKTERQLAIVLSPEDKNLQLYDKGTYYVITAFEKEVKREKNKKANTR